MKNVKLFAGVVGVALIAAGCTGNNLPTSTNATGAGFQVSVSKNGTPVANKTVFLKQYNGVSEGSYGNSSRVANQTAKTDSQGIAFLQAPGDAVTAGGLFGVGYDAGDENAQNKSAATLTDEVQWFTTPAINLANKTGNRQTVSIDIGWAVNGFTPQNGANVTGKKVEFTLPAKQGATEYEVVVNQGTVAGSGTKAFSDKKATPSFTWNDASNGSYNYTGKFFTASGAAGIQASSANLVFNVTGAQ
jgi:hypothetical protein